MITIIGGPPNLAGHRVSRVNGVLTFDTRSPTQVATDEAYAKAVQPAREARGLKVREKRLNRQLMMMKTKRLIK
jgi:hypothetical protein